MIDLSSPRDVNEFKQAKFSRREPILFSVSACTEATFVPSSSAGFRRFLERLKCVRDWGQACESVERLEHVLFRKFSCQLPTPRKVTQNENRSLSLFFRGGLAVCHPDGFVTVIGDGSHALRSSGITAEFLMMLQLESGAHENAARL